MVSGFPAGVKVLLWLEPQAGDHHRVAEVKRSGEALAGPDCLAIVQLVGKAFQKMADAELAKVPN